MRTLDGARVDSQIRTMDQAYGGTGSPRYYILTAFQDVRMYVVLRLLLMGNGSTPVGQGLRGSPIKWQFLKHGA